MIVLQPRCKIYRNFPMTKEGSNQDFDRLRILTSAEAFGYGPTSKLTSLVRKFKNQHQNSTIEFLGEGAALDFALQNSSLFNGVHEYDGSYPNPEDYDLVLSVMNPFTVIWGWFHRKKSIYIDSLYWFWKFDQKHFVYLNDMLSQLSNAESIEEVWALTKDVPVHHLHYIAHMLSTVSCSQFFGEDKMKPDIYRKQIKNIVTVNPIIDSSYKSDVKRDTILITLGGLLSPLNQKKEALSYVNLVLKITERFVSEAAKKYRVILATNPEVVKAIKHVPQGVIVTSLSQEEMLKTINRSLLVLTPAGITTMYECLMYETPFFVLPELHDGHYPNYLRLAGGDSNKSKRIESVFPNSLMSTRSSIYSSIDPDSEIRRIQSVIKRLNASGDSLLQDMRARVDELIQYLSKYEKSRDLAKLQHAFVFDTKKEKYLDVNEVVNATLSSNKLPVTQRRPLVGIISSAVNIEASKLKQFEALGKTLANNNINIATGASIGIAHAIGTTAKKFGSRLIGFSPDGDSLFHSRRIDNAPVHDFDSIHFNGKGFTSRSLEFIKSVDALIMISGRMGTLSEFTIAFEEGVPTFVVKGFGGISDQIESIIKYSNKESNSPPNIVASIKELEDRLFLMFNSRYYR